MVSELLPCLVSDQKGLTKRTEMVANMVMNTHPPRPSAMLYTSTKGCGAFSENNVSKSGMQKRKRTVAMNPPKAVTAALWKMLRAAMRLDND